MLPLDAGWRRAVAALLHRLVALLLALLASLTASSSPAPPVQPPPPPPAADAAELREAAFAASAAGVGFNGGVAQLRAAEFSRLRGTAYLDHAGAALYSETQVADVARALASSVMGNPHSGAGASGTSDAALEAARRATLAWCRASPGEYVVVFTANATAALKLVAESFPWRRRSRFWYALESHSSVVGMREHALRAGASAAAVTLDGDADAGWRLTPRGGELRRRKAVEGSETDDDDDDDDDGAPSLFTLPSECNFSGARLDLRAVPALQAGALGGRRWAVLLDAAKGAATHPPDLSSSSSSSLAGGLRPHFVALSYYKIFGYPTGLGALLVRADAMPLLAGRAYWGGGTFTAAAADADFVVRRGGAAGLEDGTAAFTAAAAVPRGFACLAVVGGAVAADAHARSLAAAAVSHLRALRHPCGAPAAVVYGWGAPVASSALCGQGPVVAFNMLRRCGAALPPAAVEQALALRGVVLRSGCFCNPGACAAALGLSADDARAAAAEGHACGEAQATEGAAAAANAGVRGALRASFGYSSAYSDVTALLGALTEFFVRSTAKDEDNGNAAPAPQPRLAGDAPVVAALALFPLKGCAPFAPPAGAWPLGRRGALLFDRRWAAADADGTVLTQTRVPRLARLAPTLDLRARTLTLRMLPPDAAACAEAAAEEPLLPPPLKLPLGTESDDDEADVVAGCSAADCTPSVRVCGSRRACASVGAEADAWLSAALRMPCRLVRCGGGAFANEAAMTVITTASVTALNAAAARRAAAEARPPPPPTAAARFRANVLLCGTRPYEEDGWGALATAGEAQLRVVGACGRCPQVCIDAAGGRTGREPLLTLSAERMRDGRPRFGIMLAGTTPQGSRMQPAAVPASDVSEGDADDAAWMARHWPCVLRVGEHWSPQTMVQFA